MWKRKKNKARRIKIRSKNPFSALKSDDVVEKRTAIFAKYGPVEQAKPKAEGLCHKWSSVVIRINPDKIISFDYSNMSLL